MAFYHEVLQDRVTIFGIHNTRSKFQTFSELELAQFVYLILWPLLAASFGASDCMAIEEDLSVLVEKITPFTLWCLVSTKRLYLLQLKAAGLSK